MYSSIPVILVKHYVSVKSGVIKSTAPESAKKMFEDNDAICETL